MIFTRCEFWAHIPRVKGVPGVSMGASRWGAPHLWSLPRLAPINIPWPCLKNTTTKGKLTLKLGSFKHGFWINAMKQYVNEFMMMNVGFSWSLLGSCVDVLVMGWVFAEWYEWDFFQSEVVVCLWPSFWLLTQQVAVGWGRIHFDWLHDDVMIWKWFPHYWPFVRRIHWLRNHKILTWRTLCQWNQVDSINSPLWVESSGPFPLTKGW